MTTMAAAYECDVCGKLFTSTTKTTQKTCHTTFERKPNPHYRSATRKVSFVVNAFKHSWNEPPTEGHPADVCPECFKEALKGGIIE
jgi:methionyl-tRNA synthetase